MSFQEHQLLRLLDVMLGRFQQRRFGGKADRKIARVNPNAQRGGVVNKHVGFQAMMQRQRGPLGVLPNARGQCVERVDGAGFSGAFGLLPLKLKQPIERAAPDRAGFIGLPGVLHDADHRIGQRRAKAGLLAESRG